MMQNLTEHLLTHLAEEAAEIVQRVTKISRFGLDEIQVGKTQTNRRRLAEEVNQLITVVKLLDMAEILPDIGNQADADEKLDAMGRYGGLSVERGTLSPEALTQLKAKIESLTCAWADAKE